MLRQDLEKDDAEEHVVEEEEYCVSDKTETEVLLFFLGFLGLYLVDALVKSELRKVASRPPGEIGCFTFFKSV